MRGLSMLIIDQHRYWIRPSDGQPDWLLHTVLMIQVDQAPPIRVKQTILLDLVQPYPSGPNGLNYPKAVPGDTLVLKEKIHIIKTMKRHVGEVRSRLNSSRTNPIPQFRPIHWTRIGKQILLTAQRYPLDVIIAWPSSVIHA